VYCVGHKEVELADNVAVYARAGVTSLVACDLAGLEAAKVVCAVAGAAGRALIAVVALAALAAIGSMAIVPITSAANEDVAILRCCFRCFRKECIINKPPCVKADLYPSCGVS